MNGAGKGVDLSQSSRRRHLSCCSISASRCFVITAECEGTVKLPMIPQQGSH